jgi:tRNA(fMet)-specific endonuclease VapC
VDRRQARLDDMSRDEDDVAIAAVTVAELLVGVMLADRRHRPGRQSFVDDLLAVVPVESYDTKVAGAHAALLAYVRKAGSRRGAHDLMIAATAVARDREVVSLDAQGFVDLPGVRIRA